MAENEEIQNDGTWSSLKKTIVGSLSTLILAGGTWVGTTLFGGSDDKEATKTEQVAPVINLNVDNSSQNNATNAGGTTTIIKERVVEKPATAPAQKVETKPEKKSETEDAPW